MKLFHNRKKEFESTTWSLGPELYRLAYWRLSNQQDAEDAVQECYLRAFRSFHTFQKGTNIKGWMTRILINAINDALSKRSKQNELVSFDDDGKEIDAMPDLSAGARNPETQLMEKELRPELKNALQRLPSTLLNPLLLRELEDMSYAEIATTLGIPPGTVMSRLFRARQIVKDQLSGHLNSTKSIHTTEVAGNELQ